MQSSVRVMFAGFFALTLLALSAAAAPEAGEVYRFDNSTTQAGLALTRQSATGVELQFGLESFRMNPVTVSGETMQTITMPGVMLPNDAGAPNLPGLGRFIALPEGATARLEIVSSRTEVFQNVAVAPAPPLPKENDDSPPVYAKDTAIYERDAFYPQSPALLSEVRQLRGVDVVTVGVTPFQYNPVTRELVVYTDLQVRVEFEGGNGQFGEARLRNRYWEPLLQDHLLNYEMLPAIDFNDPTRSRTGADYVIICPDDPDFIAWADTLRNWRTLQGITTAVYTTSDLGGTSSTVIENFLNDAYGTWDPAPAAFLLLGDYPSSGDGRDSGITSPFWNSYCVSDNIYADVDGDDLPEMAHARITARNAAELETMINKMLSYEREPYTDPGFYARPVIAGGWQTERWFILCCEICLGFQQNVLGKTPTREYAIYSGTPGTSWSTNQNTYMLLDYFGPDGLGYIPSTPAHLTDWGGNATRVNNDLNLGAYMMLHRDHGGETGWGEPDYDSGDLNNLTNDMYPFVFSINCLTGKYNWGSECFTEKFHRITHGALGLTAASEVSYSFVNDTYIFGLMDSMWPEFDPGYGERLTGARALRPAFANTSGKYYLQASNWPYNPQHKVYTDHLFHHHGDAFMTMYSEVPQDLTVIHDDVLFTDVDMFTVQADEGSVIALTVDGELIGVAGGTGLPQDIAIAPQVEPGELRITVTKANYFRYDERVAIIPPSGAYVVVGGQTIDDDLEGDSAGNADGGADAGEALEILLSLRNVGSEDATNVSGTIRTDDPYVTIVDSVETFGLIRPDENVFCAEDFDVLIGPDCPDGHTCMFDIEITSDDRLVWMKSFTLDVEAPVIEFVDYVIDDTAGGDGDGRVDPGETVLVTPQFTNSGSEDATNLEVTLGIDHESVTILQGVATLAFLEPGAPAYVEQPFQLEIAANCPDPDIAVASMVVTADWGQQAEAGFDLPIGGFFDDIEAGAGGWTHAVVTPDFADQWHLSTQRNYTPGGSYSWKFGDTGTGDYASLADGALVTEPLNLRETCYLKFRHWMDAETSSAYPEYCYDGGMVEMSIDGGEWVQITPTDGYTHLIRAGGTPGPWPAETPVFSGQINWKEEVFEITEESGVLVQFRFRFGSDGAVTAEGWYLDEVEFFGSGVLFSDVDDGQPVALFPAVAQNQPNPFGPETTIRFQLPKQSRVQLRVFDPSGRLVRTLVDGRIGAGVHQTVWDGRNQYGQQVGSGIYFYRFDLEDTSETRKMVLTR